MDVRASGLSSTITTTKVVTKLHTTNDYATITNVDLHESRQVTTKKVVVKLHTTNGYATITNVDFHVKHIAKFRSEYIEARCKRKTINRDENLCRVLSPSQNILLSSPLFFIHIHLNDNEYRHTWKLHSYVISLKRIIFCDGGSNWLLKFIIEK
jgi:hypothetical protein